MLGPANSSSISVHEVHKNFIVADTPAKITSPRQSCSAGWTSTRRLQLELCGFEPNSPAQLSSSSLCSQPTPCFSFVTRRPSLRDVADSPLFHCSPSALKLWTNPTVFRCVWSLLGHPSEPGRAGAAASLWVLWRTDICQHNAEGDEQAHKEPTLFHSSDGADENFHPTCWCLAHCCALHAAGFVFAPLKEQSPKAMYSANPCLWAIRSPSRIGGNLLFGFVPRTVGRASQGDTSLGLGNCYRVQFQV